ncbi:hypothetical protein [Cohnella soli]|uniref:Uncharacterized protein n=1 Tax=Cohnella soli TaxID=425005 RepID=A0ABW0HM45_9BACL
MLDNFLKDLLNMSQTEKMELLQLYQELMRDQQLKLLTKTIASITDDACTPAYIKKDTLDRVGRYVVAAKQHTRVEKSSGQHEPILEKYMVIKVNFAGLGSELDSTHYGIVWETGRRRDHVSIIPTTSFKQESTIETGESFNIGKVDFLDKETVVMMNQITSVSRKRITGSVRHYDPGSKRPLIVKLSDDQKKRIHDGFRVYGLEEQTLYNKYIKNSHADTLPVLADPEMQYSHLFRPVIEISNTKDLLVYKLYDDAREYRLERKSFSLTGSTRVEALKNWVEATATLDPADPTKKTYSVTRDDARRSAYAVIQTAIAVAATPAPSPTGS